MSKVMIVMGSKGRYLEMNNKVITKIYDNITKPLRVDNKHVIFAAKNNNNLWGLVYAPYKKEKELVLLPFVFDYGRSLTAGKGFAFEMAGNECFFVLSEYRHGLSLAAIKRELKKQKFKMLRQIFENRKY